MRFLKIIGLISIISCLSISNLNAQTTKSINTQKKTVTEIKSVPAVKKTALKTISNQASNAQKMQIKKTVRRSSLTKRPIRKR